HPAANEAPRIAIPAAVAHDPLVDVGNHIHAGRTGANPDSSAGVASDIGAWLVLRRAVGRPEPAPLLSVAAQDQVAQDGVPDAHTAFGDRELLPCVLSAPLLAES